MGYSLPGIFFSVDGRGRWEPLPRFQGVRPSAAPPWNRTTGRSVGSWTSGNRPLRAPPPSTEPLFVPMVLLSGAV